MRLLAASERKKAQEMIRQVEMARAVTPPRSGPGPSRLGPSSSGASPRAGNDQANMAMRSRREEHHAGPTVLKGVAAKPSPAGGGLESPSAIDRESLVSPEAVAVATTMQAAAFEAGASASAAAGLQLPVATDSFSWDRFWVAVEELLEILPKPLFDGQEDAADVLGGLEEDFIAIRRSSSLSIPFNREDTDGYASPRDTPPMERTAHSPSTTEDAGFFVVPSPRQPAGSGLKHSSSNELPTVRVFLDQAGDGSGGLSSRFSDDDDDAGLSTPASDRLMAENRRLKQETERLRQELRQERRTVSEVSEATHLMLDWPDS